ncbi:3-oxoacyl-reductase 4 [Podospora fimiseda]|uniref:3-oxoacyl-reductase 4 n=1 Tax=Podospora fimiseda TaxID=252190 RepID=A0AAN7BKR3_9PEZI|nr:3-oxoacyl-reductase 4 [Podospora fimiseda]
MNNLKVDSYWRNFLATKTPEIIAKQLLKDAARLDEGRWPSHLAMHMPLVKETLALEVANYLTPSRDLPLNIKRFIYKTIIRRLRKSIREGDIFRERPLPEDGYLLAADYHAEYLDLFADRKSKTAPIDQRGPPTMLEVQHALHVLRYVQSSGISEEAVEEVERVMDLVEEQCAFDNEIQQEDEASEDGECEKELDISWRQVVKKYQIFRPFVRPRICYICGFLLLNPHPFYRAMCLPCGAFNYAGNAICMPNSMRLPEMTALVTGARINLGYFSALRLLRCGARVIATSRYPNDAVLRYSRELDFNQWKHRLKVIGADFRLAQHAFALVKATKIILAQWGTEKLDILINNAAQTITESVHEEEYAVLQDKEMRLKAAGMNLIQETEGYEPQVRCGLPPLALYGGAADTGTKLLLGSARDNEKTETASGALTFPEPYTKSSWIQTISEIPYEEVISAHAINALVPLILCRELLPIMGNSTPPSGRTKPLGYILNISSREGLFETSPRHIRKQGTKVHNNMNKAALNMITQTEASTAWKTRRVAMNSIDPGYLSHAPEMDAHHGGELPLTWEDGVGRVLWPVAIGEVEGDAVWGRFLKHYGASDEDSFNVDRSI